LELRSDTTFTDNSGSNNGSRGSGSGSGGSNKAPDPPTSGNNKYGSQSPREAPGRAHAIIDDDDDFDELEEFIDVGAMI